ncbi:MAG: hypothetical protein QXT73_05670 [Candidatus Methanomethylicaceae archaeon]
MPTKKELLEALDEIFKIASSDDASEEDLDEIARISGEVLGYETEEE